MLRVVSGACWALVALVVVYVAMGRPSLRWTRDAARGAILPGVPGPIRLDQPVPWETPDWLVTNQVTANGVLVVEVQSARTHDALEIARDIVALVGPRYSEVLVYVRRPAAPLAARRIQWTARAGAFVELNLEAEAVNAPAVGGRR